ncbi:uncharacterized protein B0J16DRAFT_326100 [Fusarium flagelliforme]|uniref:uncharacterized protein n=1 Tax=Fusarium flagelliforme TaxID=2675880 RepID=UPI001E8E672A|nr:uncharacterized protein B0J16DRAFT_326100 [Fusarium flagelliforme]KAH7196531.1 hypothetical protein B0J16DRAFT_326100 [Fusarium flagelliforme]
MTDTEENKADRPLWLVNIENNIGEELDQFPSNSPSYEIIRDLLLAPKDSDTAVSDAVNRFYDSYTANEQRERREPPDYMAGFKLNTIASVVFETARDVLYTSFEHDRLVEFLVGIKKGAAADYDPENPLFVYHSWGLEAIVEESWNAGHVDGKTHHLADEPEQIWSEGWLNISGLISKLYRQGLLDTDGPLWVSTDLQKALETKSDENVSSDAGRQAQVLAAINHILIAGEAFAKDVKTAPEGQKPELSVEKCRVWADKMKEIADLVDESARWDLKDRAMEGHDLMVELLLE